MLRAFYIRWHRLQNAAIFAAGGLFFSAILAFAAANDSQTEVHWLVWGRRLPLWEVALVPLLAGLVLGYVYQLPARMHSVGEWLHHRQRVHELEQELRELRSSLDHVLQMPATDRPAKLAKVEQKALPEATEAGDVDPFADRAEDGKEPAQPEPERAKKAATVKSRRSLLSPLRDELTSIKLPQTKVVAAAAKPANGRRTGRRPAAPAETSS